MHSYTVMYLTPNWLLHVSTYCHHQGADTVLINLTAINYVVYNAYAYQMYKLKFRVFKT